MNRVRRVLGLLVLALCASGLAPKAAAGDNYALVVTGASGGEPYAKKYDGWRRAFVTTLREKFLYPADHVIVLAEKEEAEIGILESYLPPAADPALVERAVADAIAETGATSPKDMGKVMKAAMARLTGASVDGKIVNELVRKKLAGA